MAVTMELIRNALDAYEPDYDAAAGWGEDAVPLLAEIASDQDDSIAPAAVHVASLIGGDRAAQLLLEAATSSRDAIRFQAAAGAANLPTGQAEEVLAVSLDDSHSGVRRAALRSIDSLGLTSDMPDGIADKIKALATSDPQEFVRVASDDLVRRSTTR